VRAQDFIDRRREVSVSRRAFAKALGRPLCDVAGAERLAVEVPDEWLDVLQGILAARAATVKEARR
jgi:hypothetical protein